MVDTAKRGRGPGGMMARYLRLTVRLQKGFLKKKREDMRCD